MCSICGKGCTTKGNLRTHQETHSDKRKYKCAICSEARLFKTKQALAKHMKIHYEPEIECKHCGKKFHTSSGLNQHMKFHNEPKYECKQCGKKFHISSHLKTHQKTHVC